MANWFKDEINHFGDTVDGSIQKASENIQKHIDAIGAELNNQRTLTKADIESLIDYAANRFGDVIEEKVEKAKSEVASLVTEKIGEVREQLTDAASEQKKVAIRNTTVSVLGAISIGAISLLYKKLIHGELDLLTIFRVILVALGCGQGIWLSAKYITAYSQTNRNKKNIVFIGIQYLGILRPRGAIGHIIIFVIVISLWGILNFWPQFK